MKKHLTQGACLGLAYFFLLFVVESAIYFSVMLPGFVDWSRALAWALAMLDFGYLIFGVTFGALLGLAAFSIATVAPAIENWRSAATLSSMTLFLLLTTLFWNQEPAFLPNTLHLVMIAITTALYALLAYIRKKLTGRSRFRKVSARNTPCPGTLVLAATVLCVFLVLSSPNWIDPSRSTNNREADSESPNVVLIVLDTLRADHLSAYGYARKTTPFLDSILTESVLFENSYSNAPWTIPSHASIFTGLHSFAHQATLEHVYLREEIDTLAEILGANGFQTAAFVANPWIGEHTGLAQGFARFRTAGIGSVKDMYLLTRLSHSCSEDQGAQIALEQFKRWITQHADERFFIFINLMEMHLPYGQVPEPFSSTYTTRTVEDRELTKQITYNLPEYFCRKRQLDESRKTSALALYDGALNYLDSILQRIYTLLHDRQLLDDTLLVITSDHGEHLGEDKGRLIDHQFSMRDELFRVPLIVRYPRLFNPGHREDELVQGVDLFPTILEAVGIPIPAGTQGRSLLHRNESQDTRPIVSEYFTHEAPLLNKLAQMSPTCDFSQFSRRLRVVRKDSRYKLLLSSEGDRHLYDLQVDPEEKIDLIDQLPQTAEAIAATIAGWTELSKLDSQSLETPDLDKGTEERLRALGYVN